MRMTAGALGLAGLVFGGLAFTPFLEQHESGTPPFALLTFGILIGLPIVIGLWGSWAPLPVLLALSTIEALAFLIALVLWPFVHLPGASDPIQAPWLLGISALPAACFALVMRGVYVWSYLGVVGILNGIVTFAALSSGDAALLRALQTGLYAGSFSAIFVGLVLVGLQSAERLDRLQAEATAKATRSAALLARERERALFDGLIHDGVISTLLMTGRSETLKAEHVRQAKDTLVQLHKLASAVRPLSPVGAETLAERVGQLAQSYEVESFVDRAQDAEQLALPADAAEALLSASGEALRNSVEHAAGLSSEGAPATGQGAAAGARPIARQLEVRVSATAVTISVRDDGIGFDESLVRPERLGVARSIRGRMSEVRGGYSAIDTRPGQGTIVILGWVQS